MNDFKLILAQGAEHTNQTRLKKIVDTINIQRSTMQVTQVIINDIIEHIRPYIPTYDIDDMDIIELRHTLMSYAVEEKFDGYSYLNVGGRFYSKRLSAKKGHEGEPIDKTEHLWYIADVLRDVYRKYGCDLHGEIYVPGGDSDDMTKILGCTADEAKRRVSVLLEDKRPHYRLLDIRAINGKICINEPYYIRRLLLKWLYKKIQLEESSYTRYIMIAPVLFGDPRDEFKRIVSGGGEGIIMKNTRALYIPGKKPANNWIKGKKKITLDVIIMDFNDGTGKNKSLFGSIKFGMMINGKLTACGNCSSGLPDETRQLIAKDPDSYINTVMEIEAIQENTTNFRNAVFLRLRDDKGPEECIPLNITVKTELI